MVQFNKLEINPEGTQLSIDVQVKELSYYENVYLSKIVIDNQDTFNESGPGSNPLYSLDLSGNDMKHYYDVAGVSDLPSMGSDLLFVYVITEGIPDSMTPCGEDNSVSTGVVSNLYPVYKCALNYIKELDHSCTIPRKFIDFILRLKALQYCILTGHNQKAIDYWKKYFMDIRSDNQVYKCICNNGGIY